MALCLEADGTGDGFQGIPSIRQHRHRLLDPHFKMIFVQGKTGSFFDTSPKSFDTHAHLYGQLLDGDGIPEMLMDIFDGLVNTR